MSDTQKPSKAYAAASSPGNNPEGTNPERPLWANATTSRVLDVSPIVGSTTHNLNIDKYLPYISDIRPVQGDLDLIRARKQSGGEKFLHFLGQSLFGEILGGSIRGFGTIAELPDAIVSEIMGGNADFTNGMMEFGNSIMEGAKESMPIYRQRPGEAWDTGDLGWWLDNGVSVFSSLSMLVPALGVTRVGGVLARATGIAGKMTKQASEITKVISTAAVMRNAENMAESMALVKDARVKASAQFEDDAAFDEWLLTPEGQQYIVSGKPIEKEAAADYVAAKAGWRSYAINSVNIVFDLIQATAFMRSNYFTRTNATKSPAIANKLYGVPTSVLEKGLRNASAYGRVTASILGEGVEESINFIGEKEGAEYAKQLLETGKGDTVVGGVIKRLGEYTADPHMSEQFFWGALGGGIFEGAGALSEALSSKDGRTSDSIKLAEINSRELALKSFNSQVQEIAQKVKDGKLDEGKAREALKTAQDGMVYSMGLAAAKAGNVDLVLETLSNNQMQLALLDGVEADEQRKLLGAGIMDDFKVGVLRVESAYNEAVNFYETKKFDTPVAKQGMIDKYVEHAFNVDSRKVSETAHEQIFAELVKRDQAYQTGILDGKNPKISIEIAVLEDMLNSGKFKGYEEFINEELAKLKAERGTVWSTASVPAAVKSVVRDGKLHKFSRIASEKALDQMRKTGTIAAFNGAVNNAIKASEETVKEDVFSKFKADLSASVVSLNDQEKLAYYNSELVKQTDERRKKHLEDEISKLNVTIKKKAAKKSTKAPVEETITPAPPIEPTAPQQEVTLAQSLNLTDDEFNELELKINSALGGISSSAKKQLIDILNASIKFVDPIADRSTHTYLQEQITKLMDAVFVSKLNSVRGIKVSDQFRDNATGESIVIQAIYKRNDGKIVVYFTQTTENKLKLLDDFINSTEKVTANDIKQEVNSDTLILQVIDDLFSQDMREQLLSDIEFVSFGDRAYSSMKDYIAAYTPDRKLLINKEEFFKATPAKQREAIRHEIVHAIIADSTTITKNGKVLSASAKLNQQLADLIAEIKVPTVAKNTHLGYFVYKQVLAGSPVELITYLATNADFADFMFKYNPSVVVKLEELIESLDTKPLGSQTNKELIKSLISDQREATIAKWESIMPMASFNAEQLAKEYGIQIGNVKGTGTNGEVLERDVQAYIKQFDLTPLENPDIQMYNSGHANLYLPFTILGIKDNKVDADEYNRIVEKLYGEKAVYVGQQELEEIVKTLVDYEFSVGKEITLTKENGAIQAWYGDILIGFLNDTAGLYALMMEVGRLAKASTREEVENMQVSRSAKAYKDWRLRLFSEDIVSDKPFSVAVEQVSQQFRTNRAIEDMLPNDGDTVPFVITRKTGGTFVKSDYQFLGNVFPNLEEVWFVPPGQSNETLVSSKDGRRYVRVATDAFFNKDEAYTPGYVYAFVPTAVSVPGNVNTMTPTPLASIPLLEADAKIATNLISEIIKKVNEGLDPLNNEDIRELIIKLSHIVNVENSSYKSDDYLNVTSDEIRFSFFNTKTGTTQHVHISYKSKFSNKPYLYITQERSKSSGNITLSIKGKKTKFTDDPKEIRRIIEKALQLKRHTVHFKKLSDTTPYRDGKTYMEYLRDHVLQTDIGFLTTPDGEPMLDKRGNRIPNVFGKTGRFGTSNLILSIAPKDKNAITEQLSFFRKVDNEGDPVQGEDIAAMQTWWNKTFGGHVPFNIVLGKSIMRNGVEAWGIFEDAATTIAEGAAKGTAYHEAFHATFHLYLDESARNAILDEAKKEYGDLDAVSLEEAMAEDLRLFLTSKETYKPKSNVLVEFFRELVSFIKALLGYDTDTLRERLFNDIASGKFAYKPDQRLIDAAQGKLRTRLVEGFTAKEHKEVVGLLTKAIIDFMEVNPNMTILEVGGSGELRRMLMEYLEGTRSYVQFHEREANLDRVIANFDKFFKATVENIQRQFGIDIDETINADAALEKNWDDTKIFAVSEKDTLLRKVKQIIMTTPSNTPGEFLGMSTYLDFNKYFPYIRRMMAGATSVGEMIARLEHLNEFDSAIGNIANRLRADDILANGWFSQFAKQNPIKLAILFKNDSIETEVANKKSSHFALSNEWIDFFNIQLEEGTLVDEVDGLKQIRSALLKAVRDQNIEAATDTAHTILSTIGITTSKDMLRKIMNNPMYGGMKNVVFEVIEPLANAAINDITKGKLDSRGRFNAYAELAYNYHIDLTEASSLNVNGDNTFDYINPHYLSEFIDKFKAVVDKKTVDKEAAKQELFQILYDYAKDPAMYFSNWLFGPNGFLFLEEGQGINDLSVRSLNLTNIKKFGYALLDGAKDTIIREGIQYGDMTDQMWLFSQMVLYMASNEGKGKDGNILRPILIPSDSGNIWTIQSPRIRGTNTKGEVPRTIDDNPNNLWTAVKNTALQEIERMKAARDLLFYQDENGNYQPKAHKLGASYNEERVVDYTRLQKNYHYTNVDSNGLPIIMQNGKPTGRVFSFQNIRGLNSVKVTALGFEYNLIEDGIYNVDNYNDTIRGEFEVAIDAQVDQFIKKLVNSEFKKLQRFKDMWSTAATSKRYGTFRQFVAEYALNSYLSNVEQFNFFVGQQSEYKNDKDTNKRAKEIVSPKLKAAKKRAGFIGASIKDIRVSSMVYDSIVNAVRRSLQFQTPSISTIDLDNNVQAIVSGYNGIVAGDAQGYMSLDRYEYILDVYGRLDDRLKELIRKMKNPRYKIMSGELQEVLQPLKGFYYGRDFDPYLRKHVSSQIKYSSMPMIPALIVGTDAEKLYKWMQQENIDEVFFESAEKVGSTHILDIATDGRIDETKLRKYTRDAGYSHRLYSNDNWGLQLDVPDHIVDATNKLATQLAKIIIANIQPDTVYQVDGTAMIGAAMVEHFQNLISANIKESFEDVIAELGAEFVDGRYQIRNEEALARFLQKEATRRSLNSNYVDAVAIVERNGVKEFNLPLYISTLATKWESILSSIFSNNVTDQRIAGGSAVVTSSLFLTNSYNPDNVIAGDLNTLTELEAAANNQDVGINWLDRKLNDRALRMITVTDENGNQTTKAEILLPATSKKFFKDGKLDDINNIPEEIRTGYWYRIPYEGKHSGLVCEVVGFLPIGTNMIVLPPEAINQSGEDMDVDKRFGIVPNFDVIDENYIKARMGDDYSFFRWTKTKAYRRAKHRLLANPTEEIKNINKQVARFKTTSENAKTSLRSLAQFKKQTKDQVAESILVAARAFGFSAESIMEAKRDARANLNWLNATIDSFGAVVDIDVSSTLADLVQGKERVEEFLTMIENAYSVFADLRETTDDAANKAARKREVYETYLDRKDVVIVDNLRQEWEALPEIERSTKEERDNQLLSIIEAIYSNPVHYGEIMSPSGFADGAAVIKEVDQLTGADKQDLNPVLPASQEFFRTQNISGRALKGMAADSNAFLTVAQIAKMELRPDLGVWMKYDSGLSLEELRAKYDDVRVTETGVYVKHTRLGWNKDGSFTNATGNVTTKHAAQTLAQILDIVKEGIPYNMNTYTYYIIANMLNVGVPLREASLMIRQPIINDITKHYFESQFDGSGITGKEISVIKMNYQNILMLIRAKLGRIKDQKYAKFLERAKNKKFYLSKKDGDIVLLTKELFNYTIPTSDNIAGVFSANELAEMIGLEKDFNLDTDIDKLTRDQLVQFETFLKKQLQVAERFLTLKESGEAWQDIIRAIPVDRKGIGPSLMAWPTLVANIEQATLYGGEGARVLVDGIPATLAVYGQLPDEILEGETTTSVYPVMQSYLEYGYQNAFDILGTKFIKYTDGVQRAVKRILSKLNKKYNEELANKIANYYIYHEVSNLAFFDVDKAQLFGVGQTATSNIERFDTISVANQLLIMKEKYGEVLEKESHILNFLHPKITKDDVTRRGVHTIDFVNTLSDDITDDELIRSFQHAWDGFISVGAEYDPQLQQLMQGIVQYNFFYSGFAMKQSSVAKLIPNRVLHEIGLVTRMRQLQAELAVEQPQRIEMIFDSFVRSNSKDTSIVPVLDTNRGTDYFSIDRGTEIMKISVAALETRPRIKNAEYVNVPILVTMREASEDKVVKVGEQLYQFVGLNPDNTIALYKPVERLGNSFLYETGSTILDGNKTKLPSVLYDDYLNGTTIMNVAGNPFGGQHKNAKDGLMYRFATQFIGDELLGIKGSTTAVFKSLFTKKYANTGVYSKNDLVMVSVQGRRGNVTTGTLKPKIVVDDKLVAPYNNITKALLAGATVMIASPYTENGSEIKSYNKDYNIGDMIVRNHLIKQVNKGLLARRIENGIQFFALAEANMQTISRKIVDLTQDESDGITNNTNCNV